MFALRSSLAAMALATLFSEASAFASGASILPRAGHVSLRSGASSHLSPRMASREVIVEADVDAVGKKLCGIVEEAAKKAIQEKGSFSLAIPGGSILKMLKGLNGKSSIQWDKAVMAYVNHRCVSLDDETSTHFKARPLFLDSWMEQGLNVLTLGGSTDAPKEADAYAAAMQAVPTSTLARSADGFPAFDLMLIGVGLDGHVGSLYPDSAAVAEAKASVVSVVKPASSSISLSLPVMKASKQIVIASAGKSDKYPLGKAEGMVRALEADETVHSFPAMAFRDGATWILDEGAAALLKNK